MQQRRQDGAPDHNVGYRVSSSRAKAFAVSLHSLLIIGSITRLVDACKDSYPKNRERISGSFEREPKLQLCGEWRWTGFINDVEIGDHAEDALRFLNLDFLRGNLLLRVNHIHGGRDFRDMEFGVVKDQILARIQDNIGRVPIGKVWGGNTHMIGSGVELLELEEAIVVGGDLSRIF